MIVGVAELRIDHTQQRCVPVCLPVAVCKRRCGITESRCEGVGGCVWRACHRIIQTRCLWGHLLFATSSSDSNPSAGFQVLKETPWVRLMKQERTKAHKCDRTLLGSVICGKSIDRCLGLNADDWESWLRLLWNFPNRSYRVLRFTVIFWYCQLTPVENSPNN